ncbi:Importin subunit beta-1 [Cryptosporidium felis]|nr:Importin subunit beta-1 [Cryptosporidium felis]
MDLTQILLNCHNSVESIRKNAEQQLQTAQETNIGEYLTLLAEELFNESKPELSRQLAGLLLKNSVSGVEPRIDIEKRGLWISLPMNITSRIKSLVLESILSPVASVRGASCQVIAKLGRVELPCKRWPELLPYLIRLIQNNSNSEMSIVYKRSSLTALGYLCEDSKLLENEVSSLIITEDISNQILTAIVQGMNDPDSETALAATKSFYFALYFARNNFSNEMERNLIFQVLCTLCGTEGNKRDLLRTAAYECLVSIASEYYEYLGPYLSVLTPMTIKGIKGVYEPVSICCVEFWNTVADIEIEFSLEDEHNSISVNTNCMHYIRQVQSILIPVMLETLLRQNDDDSDFESWTVAKAAGACLTLCSQLLGDNILEPTLGFIHSNFSHSNWHNREAAVLAYGSILEGPSIQKMQPIVETSVANLCQALNDTVVAVRDTCAWTIGRIVTFHPSTIFPLLGLPPSQKSIEHTNGLLSLLLQKLLADDSRVCTNICWVIHQIAETSQSVDGGQKILDIWFPFIVQSLIQAFKREVSDENNMKQACFNALSMIIANSGIDNDLNLINLAHELILGEEIGLKQLMEKNPIPRSDVTILTIQLVCGALYALTTKLGKRLTLQYSQILLRLYFELLRQGGATEESLLSLTSLIVAMSHDFSPYVGECVSLVVPLIQCHDELETCKISIELMGDLVRSVGKGIKPCLEMTVQTLCTLLAKNDVDRKVKPLAITALGDMSMNLGDDYIPYISSTLQLFQQASVTQYNDGPINSEDWIEYLGELRESVLQGYTGIVYGMKDAKKLEVLGPYVPNIIQFIDNIVNDYSTDFPNDSNLRSATALVGDLITAFNGQLVQYLLSKDKRSTLENICNVGETSRDPEIISNVKWVKKLCSL